MGRFGTARVRKQAVMFCEINFCRLKAGMKPGSHLRSMGRFGTARVLKRAVAFFDITYALLPVKIWHKQVLPSSVIKIKKVDCF
jgi:hypothetical protein